MRIYQKILSLVLILYQVEEIRLDRYLWKVVSWAPCSVTCGIGASEANLNCYDIESRSYVSGKYCKHITKIKHKRSCTNPLCLVVKPTIPKPEGYWYKSEFGSCSATCGRAVKSRLVACLAFSGLQVLDDSKCIGVDRPDDYVFCDGNEECPVDADWAIGAWSTCTQICEGIETRKILCRREDNGKQTNEKHCHKRRPKPPAKRACGEPCSVWVTGKWGKCRYNPLVKKCSEAKQTRCAVCVGKRTFQESSECSTSEKPATRRSCKHPTCS